MADLKISQLNETTSPIGTDILPIVSDGVTKKVTLNTVKSGLAPTLNPTLSGTLTVVGNISAVGTSHVLAGSVAEGRGTTASGQSSHAEGENASASGFASHAEGWATRAIGGYSHAEGNNTIASGFTSHAKGFQTIASGHTSTVGGYYAHSVHDRTWVWKGSISTPPVSSTRMDQFLVSAAGGSAFFGSVGIGTDNNSNALTVAGSLIVFLNLPTSAPATSGALWRDAANGNVLKVVP